MGSARRLAALFGCALAASSALVLALATPSRAAAALTPRERAIARSIVYRTGSLGVRDAVVDLPDGYRYLDARDAQRTLHDLYGNPPDPEVRALIVPPKATVLDNPYVIVVTYEADGHVSDRDAHRIDYGKLLRSMKDDAEADNAKLVKGGYDPVRVVGWAAHPHYDARTHKLYWAQDLVFGNRGRHTLNYDVRTLGREGMLALHAVSYLSALPAVRVGMRTVLAGSHFTSGRRYEDYRQGDRVSKLTIAGVVAGGAFVAAKTGLIALLVAKMKFVAFGIAGLVGALRKRLFGRTRRRNAEPSIDY
jgi:uncharacterized membrane-anchored protein